MVISAWMLRRMVTSAWLIGTIGISDMSLEKTIVISDWLLATVVSSDPSLATLACTNASQTGFRDSGERTQPAVSSYNQQL